MTFEPGGAQVVTGFPANPVGKHAHLASAEGAKLVSTVAEVKAGSGSTSNLSHTCPASATETSPSPKPSESVLESPSESAGPSGAAVSPSASASESPAGDSLAFTGTSVVGSTVAGLALLGAGGVLVARRRRRGAHR
ncbi:LPXTG cell wall anchor domain-containing protein [Kitasatospora sp. NPDC004272]